VSWLSTFSRFRPGRVPLVGSIGLLVADWSRPQRGRAAMFDSSLLERLSVVHPLMPTAVYLPVGGYLLWRSAAGPVGPAASVLLLYPAGLLIWSLLEYVTHRGTFHHEPHSDRQLAVAYLVHGVHHAYPDDSRRWMLPLVVTIPLSTILFLLFALVFGRYGDGTFAGFIHGYLAYDLLHYFIHRGRLPGRVGRFLRQHHMAHHYSKPERNFGVSSPLWDLIFRTR
jgi:dihydroceramide fatty acyl 2-hydroxylase